MQSDVPSKVTPSQVLEIRRLRAGGAPLQDLAARFGVSMSLISRVANGRKRTRVYQMKDYRTSIAKKGYDPDEVLTREQAAVVLGVEENAIVALLRSNMLAGLRRVDLAEISSLFRIGG